MNDHAVDAMLYAWALWKEKEVTMEYIYVGNVKRSKIDKDSADLLFISHGQDIEVLGDLIKYDNTTYCLVPANDILINNDELLRLKDRVKELEGKLADAKKESDKRLCEVYMETNMALSNGVYKFITLGKELEDLKNGAGELLEDLEKENQTLKDRNDELEKDLDATVKNCKFWHDREKEVEKQLEDLKSKKITKCTLDTSDSKLTFIYTYMDGHSESTCIIDDVDPNGVPRDVTPKCSSCSHFMHGPSRFAHDWCYMPIPKEGGPGYIRKLNKEEAEGPACDKFEARKEN